VITLTDFKENMLRLSISVSKLRVAEFQGVPSVKLKVTSQNSSREVPCYSLAEDSYSPEILLRQWRT